MGLCEISSFIRKRRFSRNKNLCGVIMWKFMEVVVGDLQDLKYVWMNCVKFVGVVASDIARVYYKLKLILIQCTYIYFLVNKYV